MSYSKSIPFFLIYSCFDSSLTHSEGNFELSCLISRNLLTYFANRPPHPKFCHTESIAQSDRPFWFCHLNFGNTLRTRDCSFPYRTSTGLLIFNVRTCSAERKFQFSLKPVRKHGVVQFCRRLDINFGKAEIIWYVLKIFSDNGRMTYGITTVFICPGVDTDKIVILNGFVLFSFIMEFCDLAPLNLSYIYY